MDLALLVNHTYSIELCSGEKRIWRYLGEGAGGKVWWSDCTTGTIFNEDSILYAWTVTDHLRIDLTQNKGPQNVD
ncbi:hypothetical protein [Fluviibacter phosphoraccumulans]|jgi:hypothetical protein|uniref:Uncharacterized protein n=1 Tax=Fluviibacter phosphoraccumulans TaxID=1751046 RepID=A0A455RBL6_9RHOO|nr:hypothetical protein [Fluviibacter phosphoraccumulans]BBU68876.1 hypothetical protein ICHIAU1_11590 [Fluviibacter phosphoraccumulans]BBU71972.1 hypothetical protein ICHIJ1_18910 [Fluviibacter phosphoraccumulans]BCA64782.1 hypothetical protein SHINM1_003840 [Fluviibacter phosphoraccumulans]BCA64959.1 hypothetical protein SHINM1_005610 [Fluviibacter phosphoraccumulans]